jgi:hypothetical protein
MKSKSTKLILRGNRISQNGLGKTTDLWLPMFLFSCVSFAILWDLAANYIFSIINSSEIARFLHIFNGR